MSINNCSQAQQACTYAKAHKVQNITSAAHLPLDRSVVVLLTMEHWDQQCLPVGHLAKDIPPIKQYIQHRASYTVHFETNSAELLDQRSPPGQGTSTGLAQGHKLSRNGALQGDLLAAYT